MIIELSFCLFNYCIFLHCRIKYMKGPAPLWYTGPKLSLHRPPEVPFTGKRVHTGQMEYHFLSDSNILIIPFHETPKCFPHLSWCWNIHDSHRNMVRYWQTARVWAHLRVPLCVCVCMFACVFMHNFLLPIMLILIVSKHARTCFISK